MNFNATGYRPYVTTLYAVLLGCARKTISRILVLIVSMGYGVVLPYLGAIQHKVGRPGLVSFQAWCCPTWPSPTTRWGPIDQLCVTVGALTLSKSQPVIRYPKLRNLE